MFVAGIRINDEKVIFMNTDNITIVEPLTFGYVPGCRIVFNDGSKVEIEMSMESFIENINTEREDEAFEIAMQQKKVNDDRSC